MRSNCLQPIFTLIMLSSALLLSACTSSAAPTDDWVAEGSFTDGIEGPAVGPDGKLYVPNLDRQGTIGVITGKGQAEIFIELPEGSIGNSIRFNQDGQMFIADYAGHNIFKVNLHSREIIEIYHDNRMHQPNDIALTASGLIYATDPDWSTESGQLWRLDLSNGRFTLLETDMGTTNGIELSPDGTRLYVNESVQRRVYMYDVSPEGDISNKQLVHQFDDYGLDGMKFGPDGNLYIARYGAGRITVLSPEGDIVRKIPLQGQNPTNLAMDQGDPVRVFVTLQERGAIESFLLD